MHTYTTHIHLPRCTAHIHWKYTTAHVRVLLLVHTCTSYWGEKMLHVDTYCRSKWQNCGLQPTACSPATALAVASAPQPLAAESHMCWPNAACPALLLALLLLVLVVVLLLLLMASVASHCSLLQCIADKCAECLLPVSWLHAGVTRNSNHPLQQQYVAAAQQQGRKKHAAKFG